MASVRASMDDDEMDGPVDGINITPLVDVLMVVLVMFILTATAQVAGIQVDLPKASARLLWANRPGCPPPARWR